MKEIKIISLEKKSKSKKYKVLTSDEDYQFSEDTIIKYMIFKDKVFTEQEWEKVLEDALLDEYFNKVLHYLGSSYKSVYEIKNYLYDKSKKNNVKLTSKQIDTIIDRISELGYLNDEQLSRNICDYYYRQNKGPLYIRMKLQEKKVEESIINNALSVYTDDMQKEAITRVLEKEKNDKYPLKKLRLVLLNKFIQNGFNKNIIEEVLGNWEFIDKSEELIEKDYNKVLSKTIKKELSKYEERQTIIAYLLNKGYDYQTINDYLKNKE